MTLTHSHLGASAEGRARNGHRNADGTGIMLPSISLRYRIAMENYSVP
jgi:hypothetical protein